MVYRGHVRGERVGRYVIEELLGTGGMGAVYRAYDDVLRRRVAIKVLYGKQDDDANVQRILREARMAAALEHPNVVALYDFGSHDGAPFIVMEYVNGRSLRAVIRQKIAPLDARVRWLGDVARALAAAHHAGLVHRDVKPENVMIRDDGIVKVLDFGIARRSGTGDDADMGPAPVPPSDDDKTFATQRGQLSGTPGYMAPEQVIHKTFDERSDQFAWGVVAHELLTWELPWPKGGAPVIAMTIFDNKPLSIKADALPAALAPIVIRALEREPASRYPSMDPLLEALLLASPPPSPPATAVGTDGTDPTDTMPTLHMDPASSRRPRMTAGSATGLQALTPNQASGGMSSPTARRKRRISVIGAAVAILAGSAAALLVYPMKHKETPVNDPVVAPPVTISPKDRRRVTSEPGCQQFPSLTPDGKSLVYEETRGPSAKVVAVELAGEKRRELTTGEDSERAPALSPDGRDVAFLRNPNEPVAFIAPLDGSSPARQIATGGVLPSFSPDGTAVWAGPVEKPVRFDRETLAPGRSLVVPGGAFLSMIAELPDHRVAARVAGVAGGVLIFPAGDGAATWLYHGTTDDVLTLGPDGKALIATRVGANGERALLRVPLDGTAANDLEAGFVPTKGVFVAGDQMVWSTCAKHAQIVQLDRRGSEAFETKTVGEPSDWPMYDLAWVPGTPSVVLSLNRTGAGEELWRMDPDGKQAARINVGDTRPVTKSASFDGQWLAFTSIEHGIFLSPIDGHTPPRQLTTATTDDDPAFSRDGKLVYFTARHGTMEGIDSVPVEGGAPTRIVPPPSAIPTMSPTEDALYYIAPDDEGNAKLMRFDLKSKRSTELGVHIMSAIHITISADGKRIAIANETAIIEASIETKKVLARYENPSGTVGGVAYVNDTLLGITHSVNGNIWMGTLGR